MSKLTPEDKEKMYAAATTVSENPKREAMGERSDANESANLPARARIIK